MSNKEQSTDIIGLAKSLLRRVIVSGALIISLGVFLNRGFLLVRGGAIWSHDRPGGQGIEIVLAVMIISVFLFVFPIIYLLSIKAFALGRAVGTLREKYRKEVINMVIDRVASSASHYASSVEGNISQVQNKISSWTDSLPLLLRLLIVYLKEKVPMIGLIEETVTEVDTELLQDEVALKQEMHTRVDPYIDEQAGELLPGGSMIWWVVGFNVLCIVGVRVLLAFV